VAAPLAGPHRSTNGSCVDKACHATSPHGSGGSDYALFRSKLLTAAADLQVADALADSANSGIDAGLLAGTSGTVDEQAAVRAGYTCASAGCHTTTQLTVLKAGWSESRDTTHDAGVQILKGGHVSGSAATSEGASAYAAVAGCTSCHDQVDTTTRSGYTFPHAQRATGAGAGVQTRLWMNIAGTTTDTPVPMTDSNMKSFDGACLKCHRTGTTGIGITH
jgi:hypothetical protein